MRRFGVEIDPETEAINTIGAKEGLSHLMWTLVQPGDVALVPEPSYPIHMYAPLMAGAQVQTVRITEGPGFLADIKEAFLRTLPRPRVILVSFPHNPTTTVVDLSFFEELVAFAREHGCMLVHDFAYADLHFDDYVPPSMLQVPGAKEVGVELYTLTKSHSMAGWRVGFALGNPEMIAALAKLKSYLDYGTFQPIQIASIIALNEGDAFVDEIRDRYRERRDVLVDGLARCGWPIDPPKGTMFAWAPIPEAFREMGSMAFSMHLLREGGVAVSPGVGFGYTGEGYVRFALVENRHRIRQAIQGIKRVLEAGPPES